MPGAVLDLSVLRVGLTGGMASGKSTVAGLLRTHGIPVLDADRVVHELYRPGGAGAKEVAALFGPGYLAEDGSVDRPKLAAAVFGKTKAAELAALNSRIHPLVLAAQADWFKTLEARGERLGVVEATLLLETGGGTRYDIIVVVSAPRESRIERAQARQRGLTRQELEARLDAQLSDAERESQADIVIRNDGSREELVGKIEALVERLSQVAEPDHR